MPKNLRWLTAGAVLALVTACDQTPNDQAQIEPAAEPQPKSVSMRPVEPASGDALSKAPVLRSMLPVDTYAYLRIPNFWGMIGTPTGGVLDKAIGSAAYANTVYSIREGVGSELLPELPPEARPLLSLLLTHSTSPIEIGVLPPLNPQSPMPNLLLTTSVDFADANALNTFLEEITRDIPDGKLLTPIQADKPGVLQLSVSRVMVKLDSANARLYLLGGEVQIPEDMDKVLGTLQATTTHPMYAAEAGVDTSGQGLFLWVNAAKLVEVANTMGQRQQTAMLGMFGVNDVKSISAGIGGSGSINRLKVAIEMPKRGFRAFLPLVTDAPSFGAAGEPDGIALFSLPNSTDLAAFEEEMAKFNSPEDTQKYQAFKEKFTEKLGFSIDDVLATFGQDVTLVWDDAGQYVGVRLKDAAKFQAIIDGATQRFNFKYSTHDVNGKTYHHLVVPSMFALMGEDIEPGDTPGEKFAKRILDVPSHMYWIEEDGYLLIASIPQILIDRSYISERVPVNKWLEDTQRLRADDSLALATLRIDDVPALMYRLNLETLAYLGDITGRPRVKPVFPRQARSASRWHQTIRSCHLN